MRKIVQAHTVVGMQELIVSTLCHHFFFFDGYCSTVQGLLDWFEVDLGFTELSFIQELIVSTLCHHFVCIIMVWCCICI